MSLPPKRLSAAADAWVERGLITAQQRSAILDYETQQAPAPQRRLAWILAGLGGALVFTGLALVIRHNWHAIPGWVKIGNALLVLLALEGGGYRLRVHPGRYPRTGDALLMAGSAFFICCIALVSQVFNLDGRAANALLIWFAGIATIPFLTRSVGAWLATLTAGLFWFFTEISSADSWITACPPDRHHLREEVAFAVAAILGASLFFAGRAARRTRWAPFAGSTELAAAIGGCFALFILTFGKDAYYSTHPVSPPLGVLLAVLALGGSGAALRCGTRWERWLVAFWLAVLLVPAAWLALELTRDLCWWLGLGATAGLFVLNYAMIRAGLAEGREALVNVGIGFIGLNVFARYWDFLGSRLSGGVFFIVTGLVFLGGGWYLERQRRQLIGSIHQEAA